MSRNIRENKSDSSRKPAGSKKEPLSHSQNTGKAEHSCCAGGGAEDSRPHGEDACNCQSSGSACCGGSCSCGTDADAACVTPGDAVAAGAIAAPVVRPEILAPAGDMQAALAGLAAGADALYLGLKHFSARMQAENFSTSELASLTDFAHAEGRRIYVAMNTLLKPGEPGQALRLIRRLALDVRPDALIVQDPAMIELARQAGFAGEMHLSTLANITHPKALQAAHALGASRVIVPRELSIDEVRLMNDACPEGLDLEIFVHGALCYCVSGRCWWSSYMGGKSGLRGRCVQPCRRVYKQKGREGRFFSCMDLSLDVLARNLLTLPRMRSWKIEGRKKGPHYVYYVTSAYRLLRDEPNNPEARKEAEQIIGMALGRPGTRSLFLPQKPQSPTTAPPSTGSAKDTQTSSGLLCGRVGKGVGGKFEMRPRLPLLPKDYLRVGYEDEPWHCTVSIPKWVQEGATFTLSLPRGKNPKPGTPVFLIDRKEPELMTLISDWGRDMQRRTPQRNSGDEDVAGLAATMPVPLRAKGAGKKLDIVLRSSLPHGREGKAGVRPGTVQGLWLSPRALREVSKTLYERISWWLPPVIWPDEEDSWSRTVHSAVRSGARHFVCNSPWQMAYFTGIKGIALTAGPFCNIANAVALGVLANMGFNSAIISPELSEEDILSLPEQSPLPLGLVIAGFWPAGITRHSAEPLKAQEGFQSPKGEEFWMRRYGQNTWLYPAWPLDITHHRPALERAGYTTFITMDEHPPKTLVQGKRVSEFNWKVDML